MRNSFRHGFPLLHDSICSHVDHACDRSVLTRSQVILMSMLIGLAFSLFPRLLRCTFSEGKQDNAVQAQSSLPRSFSVAQPQMLLATSNADFQVEHISSELARKVVDRTLERGKGRSVNMEDTTLAKKKVPGVLNYMPHSCVRLAGSWPVVWWWQWHKRPTLVREVAGICIPHPSVADSMATVVNLWLGGWVWRVVWLSRCLSRRMISMMLPHAAAAFLTWRLRNITNTPDLHISGRQVTASCRTDGDSVIMAFLLLLNDEVRAHHLLVHNPLLAFPPLRRSADVLDAFVAVGRRNVTETLRQAERQQRREMRQAERQQRRETVQRAERRNRVRHFHTNRPARRRADQSWPRGARAELEWQQFCGSLSACLKTSGIPECPICLERRVLWLRSSCGHGACRQCLKEHLRVTGPDILQQMRHLRSFNVSCFMPDCEVPMDAALVATYTPGVAHLAQNLSRREILISRNPQGYIDCPDMDCVGVGYRGQRHIMCFMCERRWEDPDFNALRRFCTWLTNLWPFKRVSRPCPHCGVAIVKDGGCRNMRCGLCRRIFYWGPSGNDPHRANPFLAPPE